jgi:hypothetical protein
MSPGVREADRRGAFTVPLAGRPFAPGLLRTVGSRVRVTLPPGPEGKRPRFEGTLLEAGPDSVRVAWLARDTTALPAADVRRLEVSLGQHRPVLSSIGRGALIGGGSLALVSFLSADRDRCDESGCDWFYLSPGEAALVGGLMGLSTGAVRWSRT